jgi:adhesin/invasin
VRLRQGWRQCGCVVVSVCLVSFAGLLAGCEKAGGGGGQSSGSSTSTPPSTTPPSTTPPSTTPPSTTPPSTTPPSTTPPTAEAVIVDIGGITLATAETSLIADGTSSTTVTATLINSAGNPSPDGINVTFTTDKGRFTPDGAKSAAATTRAGTGVVVVPFLSEPDVVGTATIVASANGVANSIQLALTGPGEPARVILSADATTIPLGGKTGITAQILDDEGNEAADGTAVLFKTNLAGTGVTPSVTTVDGTATAIFSAGTRAGVATVTATAGTVSASISVTIQAGDAGSLDFVSADPTVIGVRGSALPQKSTITFRVLDQNGNLVADNTQVSFALISGLGGGEFIAPTTGGTAAGLASTVLTSGTVAGPVRIRASVTVGTNTLTSSSTNVSITGGPPSAAHLSVASSFVNIAGQVFFDIICPVDGKVADRFGNPVPPGTAVSFFTNGGIVGAQGLTDELGDAPSRIKTAAPIPHVGPTASPTDPRTGLVTLMVVTQGEETFADSNGNGLFDGPQEFPVNTSPSLDTPEPFIDHITLCNGTSFPAPCPVDPVRPPVLAGNQRFDANDPFELFIDGNRNGSWDPPNGRWDEQKPISASTRVLFSGPTVLRVGRFLANGTCLTPSVDPINGNPSGFTVPQGGVADRGPFCILVSDPGGHPLVGGTTITVTTSAGAISGTNTVVLPDTQLRGPGITLFTFTVIDDDPTDGDPAKSASVLVSVKSPPTIACPGGNGNADFSFGGTVD